MNAGLVINEKDFTEGYKDFASAIYHLEKM